MQRRIRNGTDYGSILSAKQKKQIVKERKKQRRLIAQSVQAALPFETVFQDGTLRVNERYYSRMLKFEDINYLQVDPYERDRLFSMWCSVYNYFDPTVHLQMCWTVGKADLDELKREVDLGRIARENGVILDEKQEELRSELTKMLNRKLEENGNNYVRKKYIVYGVEGKSRNDVRTKLLRIESDLCSLLNQMGSRTHILSGYERLKVMRDILNPEDFSPFTFNFDLVTRTGLSCKDFISPSSFDFSKGYYFRSGENVGASCFFRIETDKLDDSLMSQFQEVDANMTISIHAEALDQDMAIKLLKEKLTDVEGMKIDEQKKAVRSGYDMDIVPPDIDTYGKSIQGTLEQVQSGDDRMFIVTMIVTVLEKSKTRLDRVLDRLSAIARQGGCALKKLDWRQEDGYMSSLPVGVNRVNVHTARTTRALAAMVPFTTVELLQNTGQQLYGGVNRLSGNLIMIDRKTLDNPNGVTLGIPGAGKSYATKEEILFSYLVTPDHIFVCDHESEYSALILALGGVVIVIAPNSRDYINPMEISLEGMAVEDAISLKVEFVLSLCELIIGGNDGLEPIEMSIIDLAADTIYNRYAIDPVPEKMPILGDLYEEILHMNRPEAERIATKMERFVNGTSNFFNHRTTVDLSSRLISFDIQNLGEQLKKIAMMTIQDLVWNRVKQNRAERRNTRYMMDEFHLLLRDRQTAEYTVQMFKRFRKYGGIPTAITQNITDLLASQQVSNIFSNCEYIRLLKQRGDDARELRQKLHLSDAQMKEITGNKRGSGLLFFGDRIIPFEDTLIDRNSRIYQLLNTKLEDMEPENGTGTEVKDA